MAFEESIERYKECAGYLVTPYGTQLDWIHIKIQKHDRMKQEHKQEN